MEGYNIIYREGIEKYQEECFLDALNNFERVLELRPDFAGAWHQKGECYFQLEDYSNSYESYKKATEINPKLPNPWHGLGTILSFKGNYKEAIINFQKCILLCGKNPSPFPFSGIGNAQWHEGDYSAALESFKCALNIDADFKNAWLGLGNVYTSDEKNKEAEKAYLKAIEIDAKFPKPWLGRGNLRFKQLHKIYQSTYTVNPIPRDTDEFENLVESTRAYFNRAIFLGLKGYKNLSSIFSFYKTSFTAPLLVFRLISNSGYDKVISAEPDLVADTLKKSGNIIYLISYLLFKNKFNRLESKVFISETSLHQWLSIVYYYMGDPLMSYEIINKNIVNNTISDLRSYYYLLLSCDEFSQNARPYYQQVKNIISKLKPKANESLNQVIIKQRYYAGLILFYLNENLDLALIFLGPIYKKFLPAAYLYLEIYYELNKNIPDLLIAHIAEKEEYLKANKMRNFSSGFNPIMLDLKNDDWWASFYHYFYHEEIQGGIKLFYERTNKEIGFESTNEVLPFWDTWLIENPDKQSIEQLVKDYFSICLGKIILSDRQKELEDIGRNKISEQEILFLIRKETEPLLFSLYKDLIEEESSSSLELFLGEHISKKSLKNHKHFHILINIFYDLRRIDIKQKILLDFYVTIQDFNERTISSSVDAGLKDSLKLFYEGGIGIIQSLLEIASIKLPFLKDIAIYFIKGYLADYTVRFLRFKSIETRDYNEFKNNIELFLGIEKERLSENFTDEYPLIIPATLDITDPTY